MAEYGDMRVDFGEFRDTLRRYVAKCPRGLAEILNRKLLYIARGAWRRTPRASREGIQSALEVKVTYVGKFSKRRPGKMNWRMKVAAGSGWRLFGIINARRARAGEPGLYGAKMEAAARTIMGKRFRAVGTLAAGWVGIIRKLSGAAREAGTIDTGPSVKGRGMARTATPSWDPSAELEYRVIEKKGQGLTGRMEQIDPRVRMALEEAFGAEQASMEEYILKKMQEEANASGMNG